MSQLFDSCPPMDLQALEQELLYGVLADDNYLFYRTGVSDCGWPGAESGPFWELYCTACHTKIDISKRRGFKVSELDRCPHCAAKVDAKRWIWRNKLQTRILFYKFQRGEGRQIWLRAYRVTHDFAPDPGAERFIFVEVSRYLFDDGLARKWARTVQYFGADILSRWTERKRVTKTKWRIGANFYSGDYPAFIGAIDVETIRGSCLEYSQLDRAISAGFDIPEYLDFYLKYPMIEYLWKFGMKSLLWSGLMGKERKYFQKAVNLRAKRPKDLLRGLSLHEAKYIAANDVNCKLVCSYQRLRKAGIVTNSPAGWEWARAVSAREDMIKHAERLGVDGRTLHAYLERQSARSQLPLYPLLLDYNDYLCQLERLGAADGDLLPDDLRAVHERLSMRLNRQKNAGLNPKFRARRRLYSWLCWRHGGYFIRPVDSADEIAREGERQRNCVASYASRHASGDTIICVLRRASAPSESWCTVELNPRTLEVRQCRAYRNADAPPEAWEFVTAWSERLKSMKFERKTA